MLKALTLTLAVVPGLAVASYGPDLTYETAHGGSYMQVALSQPVTAPVTPVNHYCVVPQVLTAEAQASDVTTLVCAAK